MLAPEDFYTAIREQEITFFTGVPDSLLKDFCAYIDAAASEGAHIIAANEGGAIALAAGHYLATGTMGLVYMQNSGLGNAINPLISLADEKVYQVPMLLLIGWRGEPNVADEPQHAKMGEVTPNMLESVGIPYAILSTDLAEASLQITSGARAARERSAPYALIVQKNTFSPYKADVPKSVYSLSREAAVREVLSHTEESAVILSTTGKLSRELFEIREEKGEGHAQDFLTVGSMGHASQIALGIALAQPGQRVYCFDGDGAVLMHMGGLAIIGQQQPRQLIHVVFNNGSYESVGGQATAAFTSDLCAVATACGYASAVCVEAPDAISATLKTMQQNPGPHFLEIRIQSSSRDDLGRPTRTPVENKEDFMALLRIQGR